VHADKDHESLALLFCNTWQQVPSNRLDMLQFVLELRSVEASRQLDDSLSLSGVQPGVPTPILSPLPETESAIEGHHSLTMNPTEPLQLGILTPQSPSLNDRGVLTTSELQFGDYLMVSTLSAPYGGNGDDLAAVEMGIPKIKKGNRNGRSRRQ
jgi:hypothetical protein